MPTIFILHLFLLKRKGQDAYFLPHPVFFFFFFKFYRQDEFFMHSLGEALAYHAVNLGISTFPIKILYLKK